MDHGLSILNHIMLLETLIRLAMALLIGTNLARETILWIGDIRVCFVLVLVPALAFVFYSLSR